MATVTDTIAEPRALALLNSKPVVGFEVARSKGASEVEVGAAVKVALAELREAHPAGGDRGLQLCSACAGGVRRVDAPAVRRRAAGRGGGVAVLRDWRATFVSAVALPLSVIPAFIGMQWLGFSINVITLLALSLVVGILVDDAIVEVENIVRHLRMGKTPTRPRWRRRTKSAWPWWPPPSR